MSILNIYLTLNVLFTIYIRNNNIYEYNVKSIVVVFAITTISLIKLSCLCWESSKIQFLLFGNVESKKISIRKYDQAISPTTMLILCLLIFRSLTMLYIKVIFYIWC